MRYIDGQDEVEKAEKVDDLDFPDFPEEPAKGISWYHRVLLSRSLKIGLTIFILAFVIPPILYHYVFVNGPVKDLVPDGLSVGICSQDDDKRLPCGRDNITMEECDVNCCYNETEKFCFHRIPSRFNYKLIDDNIESGVLIPRFENISYLGLSNSINLTLYVNEIDDAHLNFVLYDSKKVTYPKTGNRVQNKLYNYTIYIPEFHIEVFSMDKKVTKPLFSTVRGPLIATEDFWEWSFYMTDDHLYGLGDIVLDSKEPEMFYNNDNNTATIPFAMAHRNGSFHGIYIESEAAMEVSVSKSKVIFIRNFNNEKLSVHFFYGKRPADVLKKFNDYIGRQRIPPYWALGAHFCRGNSSDFDSAMERFNKFTTKAKSEQLPYDSDCISDDFFQYINFQMDENEEQKVVNAINDLKTDSKHFIPSIRPHVVYNETDVIYDSSVSYNILMESPWMNDTFIGVFKDKSVVYPDYSMAKSRLWLNESWTILWNEEAIVLKDNWPRNEDEILNCSIAELPYVREDMYEKFCETLPWKILNPINNITQLRRHNSYGTDFEKAVEEVFTSEGITEPFVISSSVSVKTKAAYLNQHVEFTWSDMKKAFNKAVSQSMSGFYIQSIPVCGDFNSTIEKDLETLCIKWYLTSMTLPIFYVQSDVINREPMAFSGFGKNLMMKAMEMRNKLLPYYNTILNHDEPILRGMFYEFLDDTAMGLDEQFMVGKAIMVAPEFQDKVSTIDIYFPEYETWYDLWSGETIDRGTTGWLDIPIMESEIQMYFRGGNIIPIQESVFLTAEERRLKSDYTLMIGLNCTSDTKDNCYASGSLYIANGLDVQFEASETNFTISLVLNDMRPHICDATKISSSIINKIKVYGLKPNSRILNKPHHTETDLQIDMCTLQNDFYIHEYVLI